MSSGTVLGMQNPDTVAGTDWVTAVYTDPQMTCLPVHV